MAENDHQPWATRFQTFLLSVKRVVEAAREAGAASLAPHKPAQVTRVYRHLTEHALHANAPPSDG